MTKLCNVLVSASALLLSSLTISISALADPTSTLNSLVVTGQDFAISSADGASFSQQFKDSNANFTDCEATAAGTFCIDNGTYIVDLSTWIPPRPETPTDPATPAENQLTECELIGFQAPKGKETTGNCSALTFADNTLYVAGIRNRNGSAIYECDIVYDVDEGFTVRGCDLLIQDRPPILDLDRVPGGLLYVENKDSVIFLDLEGSGAPIAETLATGGDFDLAKGKVKEELQNAQRVVYGNEREAYVVTTSFGRLFAFTSAAGVVNILEERDLAAGEGLIPGTLPNVGSCGAAEAGYDTVQNADRGGLLYVSASDTCYVHALEIDSTSGFDLTYINSLQTTVDAVAYNGLTVHVYEGQNIDFSQCGDAPCPIGNFATLSFSSVAGSAASGTVWQVELIPHCAWIADVCVDLLDAEFGLPDDCGDGDDQACLCEIGVLEPVGPYADPADPEDPALTCATAPPGLLTLNVSDETYPILPKNLLDEFDPAFLPGGVFPDLWIGPQFQAQPVNNYYFDAILYDAPLAQSSTMPELVVADIPGYECPAEGPDSPLQSSMVLRVPEREKNGFECDAAGCTLGDKEHVASAITYDCSSTRSRRGCCSLYPLNTMLALLPPAKNAAGEWYLDTAGLLNLNGTVVDDSAAAKFLDSHFEQLEVFEYPACSDVDDPGEAQPLDSATCNQLAQKRLNARDKLVNALSNTSTGTNCSQSSRNYQSFLSQIENYIAIAKSYEGNLSACNDGEDNDGDYLVDEDDTDCASPAQDRLGRVQALIAHASVLPYVVNEILQPTIPAICETGWIEDDSAWITD